MKTYLLLLLCFLLASCTGEIDDFKRLEALENGDGDQDQDNNTADDSPASDNDTAITIGDFTVKNENGTTIVVDNVTGLMWQRGIGDNGIEQGQAVSYCTSLNYAGHDDWRLPTISELRSIIRGCSGTVTGGSCYVTDGCLSENCLFDSGGNCLCAGGQGPGENGYYQQNGVWEVPNGLVLWSSSMQSDNLDNAWCVNFYSANIETTGTNASFAVRCAR